MTDELPTAPDLAAKPAKKPRGKGKAFSKGFDPRRHLLGRGKLSPEQKEGAAILNAVIWKELNREHDAATLKPLDAEETITALELMVRNMIRKKPDEITARIAGKVTDKLDLSNSDGSLTINIRKASDGSGPNDK